jgi:NhaP-type Na+/H+ or K+/H+ antiporter
VDLWAVCAVAVLLFGWSVLSARFERFDVTGPIVFVVVGLVLGNGPFEQLHLAAETGAVHELAEITLVLVLFADASRVDPQDLRHHAGLPIRLLAVGLPLTMAAGFGLAAGLLTDLPWQLAALLGAALAPTDAALSAAVVSDRALPARIRRSLNLESGLNDGIATPVVTGLIAASTVLLGSGDFVEPAAAPGATALRDLVAGAGIGVAFGYLGGRAIRGAAARRWTAPGGRRVATLMLAVLPFLVARELDLNYFVAAFVAGLAFRAGQRDDEPAMVELPELLGQVLSLTVWYVFGAALLVEGLRAVDWRIAVYALLSLTVVRMVPVAVSLIGSGTAPRDTLFLGWFGPRGLASVIFGLLIAEELPIDDPAVVTVVSTIALTVVLSVVFHGVSGRPLTAWLTGADGSAGSTAASDADVAEEPTTIVPRRPFGVRHRLHD